jgi:hypothetical protein
MLDVFRPNFWDWGFVQLQLILAMCWLPMRLGWIRLQVRRPGWSAWQSALQRLRAELTFERVATVLVTIVLATLTTRTQGAWKDAIGYYGWDALLASVDRTLHGGRDPWTYLWPVLGTPGLSRFVDVVYFSWYPLFTIGLVWQAWSPDSHARRQFWVTFALVLGLLGIVAAHLFASGGPVFYGGMVAGPNPFAPLLQQLASMNLETPLIAVQLQQAVWANYASGSHEFWIAISAMPSIHVAMPVLFACAIRRLGNWASILAWGYVLVTLIGSVYLGWHYAIDGYVAVVAVLGLWWLAGWVTRPVVVREP